MKKEKGAEAFLNKLELRQIILDCCNDITFVCDGKPSGITSTVSNYIPTFMVWYGNDGKAYSDVDELMNDHFFGGASLNELCETIDFWIS